MYKKEIDWHDPLIFVRYINSLNIDYVFLYSSLQSHYSGRFSFLSYQLISQHHKITDFEFILKNSTEKNFHKWFGYFGYELKNQFEKLSKTVPSFIEMPDLWICSFAHNIVFDHIKKSIFIISSFPDYDFPIKSALYYTDYSKSYNNISVLKLMSNMNKENYYDNVYKTISEIKKGNFYQANITRKFYGYLDLHLEPLELFLKLCVISPSPYSSFLKLGKYRILSSSPEMFLRINNNIIETLPIKGTSKRFTDQKKDALSKNNLLNSEKDKAENMMIVDLMRNDLTRKAIPGSIYTHNLFEVHSYSTTHHMYSRIYALKDSHTSPFEFIKTCFPPGSVTGAPKIQAINWCSNIEKINRGVYSGCIGWINNQDTDLSVTIRTLIISDNKFEFQVGGGIIYDSNIHNEWQETLIKAKAIAKVLNLTTQDLSF